MDFNGFKNAVIAACAEFGIHPYLRDVIVEGIDIRIAHHEQRHPDI